MKSITQYWQTINIVSILLFPLSLIFCLLVVIRRHLYRIGLLKTYQAAIPIIVVGNIYIGGNGKTPFVIWLVKQLKSVGYKPAIVSRGYGASNSQSTNNPFPRRVNLQQNRELFSDEPVLIHQATSCPVFIDPVRTRAVQAIERSTDCDIIISDDGLQHYAMSRDIEINISDAGRLYGNTFCLPAGPLRESRQRLQSVDYHVFNISQLKTSQQDSLKIELAAKKAEFTMDYQLYSLQSMSENQIDGDSSAVSIEDFKGKTVHAVAGIGDPNNFFVLLKNYGLTIIEHPFADHFQYQKEDLIFETPHPIIMTEKDAVKCQSFFAKGNRGERGEIRDCWFLPIQAIIDDALIGSILQQLNSTNKNIL